MIYNAVVFVYMLLAAFPCIGEQERAAVELLVNLILTFNFEFGRIVLTLEQYTQAQAVLPQLILLAARHNLAFPTEDNQEPSFLNIAALLQAILHPLIGNLSIASQLEIYATEEEAHQIFRLSLEKIQATVDAWICENSELILPKSATTTPVDEHTHSLLARGHGDVWWNAPCMSNSQATESCAQPSSAPLTEENLRKHNTTQRSQLASNYLSIPPPNSIKQLGSTASLGVPPAASIATGRRTAGSRPNTLMPTWVKYLGINSSRGAFSNSTHSLGPQTPRELDSPRASWDYQASVGRRCTRALPWDEAASYEELDDSEMSVDMYERPHARGQKATEATFGRKLARRLKAVFNTIRL